MEPFDLHVTLGGIFISLLFALAIFWIAKSQGFFKLPAPEPTSAVTFYQALFAFLTYLIYAFILLPLALLAFIFFKTGNLVSLKSMPKVWLTWVHVYAIWGLFFLLLLYIFLIPKESRHFIFWGGHARSLKRFFKGFAMGLVAACVSYPFVFAVSLITKYISEKIWGNIEAEQVAVRQLKMTIGNTPLFSLMAIAVIFLAPFLEELLFRGFLQNLLKRYMKRSSAMIVTALIFSLAHYAYSQGAENFQLILSLLTLAYFLSFIYEREKTLWASFGLHMSFNAFNVLLILFSK